LRAARANPVFGADEKHIRTKNRVLVNNEYSVEFYTTSPLRNNADAI